MAQVLKYNPIEKIDLNIDFIYFRFSFRLFFNYIP